MRIVLKIDGQDKIFVADYITGRMLRRTIEISKNINFKDLGPKELDELVNFVVELFGKQFSIDDVYDGLRSSDLIPLITECIQGVVGEVNDLEVEDKVEKK